MHPLVQDVAQRSLALGLMGRRIVVATSGGPDSQALLGALGQLRQEHNLELTAVGIDHGLRPEASTELDRAEQLAGQMVPRVRFIRRRVQLSSDGNLLAAARTKRYEALRSVTAHINYDIIATAHTATDQIETVLLNLSRGCDLRGLTGIPQRRDKIVRPLLGTSRKTVLGFLHEHHIKYANDPSNQDLNRARGKLRHRVLDTLRELNPQLESSVTSLCDRLHEDARFLDDLATTSFDALRGPMGSLRVESLPKSPALRRRIMHCWLTANGISPNRRRIESASRLADTQNIAISLAGRTARHVAGWLFIEQKPSTYLHSLHIPGIMHLRELGLTIEGRVARERGVVPKNHRQRVAFDADKLHLGLKVRAWRLGDRVAPFGMDGHMAVGDLFTNEKLPKPLRIHWPVVTHGDEVAWVVGLRRGALAPVTAATRRITTLALKGAGPNGSWYGCLSQGASPVEDLRRDEIGSFRASIP